MEGLSSSSLTIQQEIVMIVLGTISSIISVTGSSMIIVHLYYRYRKKPTTTKSKKPKLSTWGSSRNNHSNNSNTTTIKNSNENLVATTTLTTNVTLTTTTTTTQAQQQQQDEATTATTTTIRRRMGVRTNRTLNTTNNTKNTMLGTTDRRIIFLMSLFDIIQSTNLLIQPFVLDRYDKHFHIGYGTSTTCHMAAAIHHISNAGGMYACMLNYHYLLTVRYGWSQHKLDQSKLEYLMHTIAFLWPFLTAMVGTILGVWGNEPFFMGCWVGEYPNGCEDNPDVRCKGPLFGATTAVPMFVFYLCTLFISNTLLFLHVRKISQKTLFWGFKNQTLRLQQSKLLLKADTIPSSPDGETTPTTTTTVGHNTATANTILHPTTRANGVLSNSSSLTNSQQQQEQQFRSSNRGGWSSSLFFSLGMGSSRRDLSLSSSAIMDDRRPSIVHTTDNTTIETIHRERLRRVGMQGVYYVMAGGIVYTPFLITQEILPLFPNVTQNQVYILLVIQAIVFPLDGFFNAIIYFRPRYLDIRYNKRTGATQKSLVETFYVCMFGENQRHSSSSISSNRRRTKQQQQQQQQQQSSYDTATKAPTDVPLVQQQQPPPTNIDNDNRDNNHDTFHNATTSISTNNNRRLSRAKKNELNGSVAQQLLDMINEETTNHSINETPTESKNDGGRELLFLQLPPDRQPNNNGCSVLDEASSNIIIDSTSSNVYDDDDNNNYIQQSPTNYDTVDKYDNHDNDDDDDDNIVNNVVAAAADDDSNIASDDGIDDDLDEGEIIFDDNCYDEQK